MEYNYNIQHYKFSFSLEYFCGKTDLIISISLELMIMLKHISD